MTTHTYHILPLNKPISIKYTGADLHSGEALIAIDHQNMIGTQLNSFYGENAIYNGDTIPVIDWNSTISDLKRFFCPVASVVSFADWDNNTVYQNDLVGAGVEMISAPDYPSKNVDFVMTTETSIRVGKMANIRRVILLTHDGDFAPLIQGLKNYGYTVIVVGIRNERISHRLYQACDAAYKIDPPLPIAKRNFSCTFA